MNTEVVYILTRIEPYYREATLVRGYANEEEALLECERLKAQIETPYNWDVSPVVIVK